MPFDVLIEKARIIDGTGAPWFRGAVGITDGTIETVIRGAPDDLVANERLDVDGAVLAPGFIDTHSHSDLRVFSDPVLVPKVRQGITTEILGQDGFSMAPMYRTDGADQWEDHLSGLNGRLEEAWPWGSVGEYFDAIEAAGVGPNVAMLVGHGTVRFNVLGMADRAPSDSELSEMADLVSEALTAGAIGFSTGLVYTPCIYAETTEVRRLAAELAAVGRPFVAHVRSERAGIWEAFDEFIDIGADAGIPLHLSHFKLGGPPQQGKADRAKAVIRAARERGVDITADQYPYTAGSTTLAWALPPWVHAEGPAQAVAYLKDEEARDRIRRDIEEDRLDDWENPGAYSGWDNIVITHVPSQDNAQLEGQSLAEIAASRGVDPETVLLDVLAEEELGVSIINHFLDETDVRELMAFEYVNIATDGLFGGSPHPRVYGTYPRVLGTYVREAGLFSLEEAIRKMTSLPARAMGLQRKGVIRPGMDADLVVFDPDTVSSPATFDEPKQFPRGLSTVLVAGEFVVRDGDTTGTTPGRVIRKGVGAA